MRRTLSSCYIRKQLASRRGSKEFGLEDRSQKFVVHIERSRTNEDSTNRLAGGIYANDVRNSSAGNLRLVPSSLTWALAAECGRVGVVRVCSPRLIQVTIMYSDSNFEHRSRLRLFPLNSFPISISLTNLLAQKFLLAIYLGLRHFTF